MSMTDPIADFLTRIRNGIMAAHETVEIPSSNAQEGARPDPARAGLHRVLRDGRRAAPAPPASASSSRLKYTENRTSVISGIRRVSRPGQRTYVDAKHIPKVLGGMGTAIVSTSHGVMTGHDARKAGVGGEVVAEVW